MRRITSYCLAAALVACAHPASLSNAGRGGHAYKPSSAGSREQLPDQQVQQVLNRLAFGPRPGDAAKVREMGVDKWIEQQLHPERISDDATKAMLTRYDALNAKTADLVEADRLRQQLQRQQQRAVVQAGDTANRGQARAQVQPVLQMLQAGVPAPQQAIQQVQSAKVARAATSDRQLYEVMVDFWLNHFSVFQGKQQTRNYLLEYDRDVIRPNAMGKFRDLLGAVAHSGAMLYYLDNWQSQADASHTTLAQLRNGGGRGRGGPPGGAPNPQAQAIRAACSGANTQLPPRLAQLSDSIKKQIAMATPAQCVAILQTQLGNIAQQGRRGLNENYARELMELHTLGVDGGYTQKDVIEVARALTGWSVAAAQDGKFVFRPETHDADVKVVLGHTLPAGRGEQDGEDVLDIVARHPSTARYISEKLARRFVSDDPPKALVERCAQVFTATEGDIRETLGCVVTSEEFFSRAAYRSKVKTPFEVVVSAIRAVNAQVDGTPRTAQQLVQLGQPIFGRQTPDGWPDTGDEWMNTGSILNRINFGYTLAAGRVPGVTLTNVPELEPLKNLSREKQVEGVVQLLFGGEVSKETREILMSGENPFLTKFGSDSAARNDNMNAMTDVAGRGGRVGRPNAPPGAGGRGRGAQAPPQPIELKGLAQVVGLALGAPEFQRR